MKFKKITISVLGFLFLTLFSISEQNVASENNPVYTSIFWDSDSSGIILMSQNSIEKIEKVNGEAVTKSFNSEPENSIEDYCPAEGYVLLTNASKQAAFYSFDSGKVEKSYSIGNNLLGLRCSPSQKQFLAMGSDEISASVMNIDDGKEIKIIKGFTTAAPIYDAEFSPDGKNIIWHARNEFQLQNIETQVLMPKIELWDFVDVYALSSDSSILATAIPSEDYSKNLIIFYNTTTGSEIQRIELGDQRINSISFSSDSKNVVITDSNQNYVYNTSDFQKLNIKSDSIKIAKSADSVTSSSTETIQGSSINANGDMIAVLKSNGEVDFVSIEAGK